MWGPTVNQLTQTKQSENSRRWGSKSPRGNRTVWMLQTKLIRGALTRLRSGTYGKCVCRNEVSRPERLEFMPEAPFCVKCHDRFG